MRPAAKIEQKYFLVELKTWSGGVIPFLTYNCSEDEAKQEAERFLRFMRWKGKVGNVKCLTETLNNHMSRKDS